MRKKIFTFSVIVVFSIMVFFGGSQLLRKPEPINNFERELQQIALEALIKHYDPNTKRVEKTAENLKKNDLHYFKTTQFVIEFQMLLNKSNIKEIDEFIKKNKTGVFTYYRDNINLKKININLSWHYLKRLDLEFSFFDRLILEFDYIVDSNKFITIDALIKTKDLL